jgi:hypothetical protein
MPASTVTEYLAALPADRREASNEVRRGINRALPPGYKEGIQFGMISWFVPLSIYPAGQFQGDERVVVKVWRSSGCTYFVGRPIQ